MENVSRGDLRAEIIDAWRKESTLFSEAKHRQQLANERAAQKARSNPVPEEPIADPVKSAADTLIGMMGKVADEILAGIRIFKSIFGDNVAISQDVCRAAIVFHIIPRDEYRFHATYCCVRLDAIDRKILFSSSSAPSETFSLDEPESAPKILRHLGAAAGRVGATFTNP